ncbi:MAG: hypothetical protein IJ129_00790, partial [Ruminococcus sp.]|nr:hypothetical protein [Ruminococcus sp.]
MIKKILAVTAAMLLAGCGNMISEQDHITVPKTTVTDKTPTGQEDAPTQTTASAAATTQTTTTPQTTTTAETTTTTTTTTAAATVSTAAPMTPAVVGEDVTPPTILNLEDNIYVQTGSYFDIQEYI